MKKEYTIKFIDYDGKLLKKEKVEEGKIVHFFIPKREFYRFIGWKPTFLPRALKDMEYKAKYKPKKDYDKNGVPDEVEFLKIVEPILNNKEFLKRLNYKHHGKTSVYEHSFAVSYYAYMMAKKLHLKEEKVKNTAIAGMLHDFYYNDWTKNKEKRPLFKKHGFVHAGEAKENSLKHFPKLMNKRITNSIERHMFPLNIIPPKHIEGWLVTLSDKYVSLDVIRNYKILLSFFFKKYQ
ncbi:MAG: HD domain-containing protein [Bacilli bacterium]|nr:HD domain-containing protein [Bacilli bacterium]